MCCFVTVLFWLIVLGAATASLNPTLGLLAVVACAIHVGFWLGSRSRRMVTRCQAEYAAREATRPGPER
jgi:hypothetical protein